MKKTYVKPEVYFESFELSANIATGCGRALGHTVDTCKDKLGGFASLNVFLDKPTCETLPDDAGLCYHVSTDDSVRIFTS